MPLTPEELQIAQQAGFDQSIAEFIRVHSRNPLQQFNKMLAEGVEPVPGLSVAVKDGDEAELLMKAICPRIEAEGYRAFWSARHKDNGRKLSDEVDIFETADPYLMIRLCGTDGANYEISTSDILDRLSAWTAICDLKVVGADHDWVAIQFSRLPEKICSFAEEVYSFCPDSVEQGAGLFIGRKEPRLLDEARRLCPEITVKNTRNEAMLQKLAALDPVQAEGMKEMFAAAAQESIVGIRLLALEIIQKKYLFLWWD